MAASFTTGHAIEIAPNYVTLDLNGHKVHGATRYGCHPRGLATEQIAHRSHAVPHAQQPHAR
jgi:hypothetical protein